MKQLEIGP